MEKLVDLVLPDYPWEEVGVTQVACGADMADGICSVYVDTDDGERLGITFFPGRDQKEVERAINLALGRLWRWARDEYDERQGDPWQGAHDHVRAGG